MQHQTHTVSFHLSRPIILCAQCGEALVAPEWSEYCDDRRIRHVWSCDSCGYRRETIVCHKPGSERSLAASFTDGKVNHLTTEKGFTHAWHVTGLLSTRRLAEINGWARSEPMAQQAVKHHARSVAKYWKEVKAEVVEVETLP
jgi:hypothetical protein